MWIWEFFKKFALCNMVVVLNYSEDWKQASIFMSVVRLQTQAT